MFIVYAAIAYPSADTIKTAIYVSVAMALARAYELL